VFLLAVFFLPLLLRRRYPLVMALIYWILLTYLPTQVLSFTYPVTDRYLFLPSAALCILIVWAGVSFTEKLRKWNLQAAIVACTIIALFWTKNTLDYLNEWRDPRSVWYGALKKSGDPQVYYNLGWQYSNKSASFGSSRRKELLPLDEAKKYASLVWKDNPNLPLLLNELNTGKHDGSIESEFKKYLQKTAMNYLDEAVAKKQTHVMADLFLHRGVLYLDMGETENAGKEFSRSLKEVQQLGFSEMQQEIEVNCHYNLGVVEWTLGNYQAALVWIKKAEDEQNKYGGDWVRGIF
jgi:tetratricopeptide (TPR) repeat protein